MKTILANLVFAGAGLLLAGCVTFSQEDPPAQVCVDHVRDILEPHSSLNDLWASGQWKPKEGPDPTPVARNLFQADAILKALPCLNLAPGTVVDYVYHVTRFGGMPVLYTRRAEAAPFLSFADLTNAVPQATAQPLLPDVALPANGRFMEALHADDSREGFFQVVVLYLMGDQFFHFWHDGYHDEVIVCSRSGLDALFRNADANLRGDSEGRIPDHVRQAAKDLPLAPRILLRHDTATVSVVIFTKWGGFERRTYTVNRKPPHRLLNEKRQTLIPRESSSVM